LDDGAVAPRTVVPDHRGPPGTGPLRLPWAALFALSTAAFVDVVTDLAPAGLLPGMSASLGVPEGRIGILVSGYAVASALGAIPLTALLRGLPRRRVLCSVLAGFALFDAMTAVSPSYVLTFACRLLAGALGGVLWAMLAPAAARFGPAERRGRAVTIVLAGITVALALGIPAAAALALPLGWRTVFVLLAVLAAIDAAWIRAAVPGIPGEAPAERQPLSGVLSRPGVRGVLTVTLLLLAGHQALYTYLAPFARRSGICEAALVLFVFGLSTLGGVTLAAVLADRHLRSALLGVLSLFAAVLLTLGCATHLAVAFYTAVACWGAAFGAAPTLIQIALISAAGPAHSDVATAMQTAIYNVGIAAGSFAGGLVLDYGGARTLPWVALPLVTAALITVTGARRAAFPPFRPAHRAQASPSH
jgi:predicted MFS family arabinose efflux permease